MGWILLPSIIMLISRNAWAGVRDHQNRGFIPTKCKKRRSSNCQTCTCFQTYYSDKRK